MNTKLIVRNTSIVCIITFGFLLTTEILLRIFLADHFSIKKKNTQIVHPAFQFNEDYLISLKPNIKEKFVRKKENGGDVISWETNSESYRGKELNLLSEFRIIVYGDSNIHARFSKNENTFVSRLEQYLRAYSHNNIEVVNAGIIGFGPDQSLIRFQKEAEVIKPDLVIFHIFAANDFGDLLRNRLFDMDKDGNLIKTKFNRSWNSVTNNKEEVKRKGVWSSSYILKTSIELSGRLSRLSSSIYQQQLMNHLMNLSEKEYLVYKNKQAQAFSVFRDHYDIDLAVDPGSESSITKKILMGAVIKKAKEFADQKGIQFMVLIQPPSTDLTENDPVLNYKTLAKKAGYRRERLTNEIEEICVSSEINYLNLFKTFLENHPEELYFKYDDHHWNDRGQDVAAQKAAVFLIDNGLIK